MLKRREIAKKGPKNSLTPSSSNLWQGHFSAFFRETSQVCKGCKKSLTYGLYDTLFFRTFLTVEMSALELESPIHRTVLTTMLNSFIKVYSTQQRSFFDTRKKGPLTAVKGEWGQHTKTKWLVCPIFYTGMIATHRQFVFTTSKPISLSCSGFRTKKQKVCKK